MMELTGLPSCEYDLGQWDKLIEKGGAGFEDMVLFNEFEVRKILRTWNASHHHKVSKPSFPKKCLFGGDYYSMVTDGSFVPGCHMLSKVIRYTKEDGSPGKMCMIKGPNAMGNYLRDQKGWNIERYPSLTDEEKEELEPKLTDIEDKYYIDWDEALGYFETMHTTFSYGIHTWTNLRHSNKGLFEIRISEDQDGAPFCVSALQDHREDGTYNNMRIFLFKVWDEDKWAENDLYYF
jgi:hypothetical protein